jgi:hypothetical protein
MLYPELFRAVEEVRWSLEQDVPWNAFDGTLLSDEQAQTIRMNAITWLERRLDGQIRFDGEWEKRVSTMILHNLSSLFGHSFASAQELNRYRKLLALA